MDKYGNEKFLRDRASRSIRPGASLPPVLERLGGGSPHCPIAPRRCPSNLSALPWLRFPV